jgi:hypothetical protein
VLILAGLVKRQQLKNRHRIITPVSSFAVIYQIIDKIVFSQADQKHPDARRAKF